MSPENDLSKTKTSLGESVNRLPSFSISPSAPTQHIETNRQVVESHDHLFQSTDGADTGQYDATNASRDQDIEPSRGAHDIDTDFRNLLERVQKLEQSSASHSHGTSTHDSREKAVSDPHRLESILDKSRSLGRSQPISMPKEV